MSGTKIFAIVGGLAAAGLLIQPADAATVRRHLPCAAIYFVFGGPLGGTTNSSSVTIRNSLSAAIPAGTALTYTIPGHQRTYTAPNALAPGDVLSIGDAGIAASGTCDAWFSDTRSVVRNLDLNNVQQLQIQPSP